ncbi:unnamed protein product [Amoebophrya sp. A25]|nr:unnamed protein product [Amoebophrya sp. A25]|eukprot:GSA25T00019418001.1
MGNTLSSLNPTRKNACGIVVLLFLSASKTDAVLLHQSKTKLITLSEPAPESASSGGAGRGTTSSEAASSWSLQCMTGLTGATKDVRFSFAPDRQKHELDPQTATVGELAEELGMAESQYLVLSTSTGPAETLYPKQLDEDFHKELKSIWPQRRGVFGEGTIKDCFVIVSSENLAQYQTALDIYHRFPEFGWKEARGRIKDASPHHFQPGKELLLRILPLRPDEENLVRWVDYWMELYADDALKKDPKFMHEAIVASKGYAFHYASTELKHDKKLVLAAIAEASDDKRRHILGTALQKDPGLADDKCFMRDLIAVYPGALMQIVTSDLGLELKKDYDFMLSAVEESAHVLRKLPEYKNDWDLLFSAVKKNPRVIDVLPADAAELRLNPEFMEKLHSAVDEWWYRTQVHLRNINLHRQEP